MTPPDRKEQRFRVLEVSSALLAFVISLVALWISSTQSNRSNEIAAQALETARQANEIALGRAQEYPAIEIIDTKTPKTALATVAAAQGAEISFFIKNKGRTPISGIYLRLIGVTGLTYSLEAPTQKYNGELGTFRIPIDFEEQLTPGGYAHVDITQPALKYLQSIKEEATTPHAVHRASINIVVLVRRAGEELPVQTPGRGLSSDNRTLMTIDYVPSIIKSKELDEYLESRKPFYRISPSTD